MRQVTSTRIRQPPSRAIGLLVATAVLGAACGCARAPEQPARAESAALTPAAAPNPLRDAYFGDLHVHTRYSHDAFIFNTRATPDDAYRYAKGEPLTHPGGFEVQLEGDPLDFLAVTDHAEFLGMLWSMSDPEGPLSDTALAQQLLAADDDAARGAFFRSIAALYRSGELESQVEGWRAIVDDAWAETVAAADRHYAPGEFTTFIAYEFTSAPDAQNLHRNVIFRDRGADQPWSAEDSPNPEDLWAWLDARRAEGIEALAIPHNSNGSNGQMFELETFEGSPLDAAYAEQRMRNEPLVEVTQVKGTSDTHPMLSPNDEWANFEILPFRIASTLTSDPPGSYAREAYLNGLELEAKQGFNPYKFGLIGSSDTHNAAGSYDESSFFSKVGVLDDTPQERGSVPGEDGATYADTYYKYWSASGLAGVWAEENTREAIYDALRRKETFATTGPRIRVRFFAGYDFDDALLDDSDAVAKAYAGGLPMGADLLARGEAAPRFLVWAIRDPRSAPLERVQIVKGWVENGEASERVFDVACSDEASPDPETHRCPDNGARVDLEDCSISENVGDAELRALWNDPAFSPGQRAFYYVRALENPTCRWSTWDALRAGVEPRQDLPATIQERAWSSPIWYVP